MLLIPLFIPILYNRFLENRIKSDGRKALAFSIIFMISSLLTFSPWLLKNYRWTGNPIYPLYDSLFQPNPMDQLAKNGVNNGNIANVIREISQSSNNVFANRKVLYQEHWWQTFLLPIRFFFEGQDGNPRYFDGKLNPFLFILPFFAFTRKTTDKNIDKEMKFFLVFSLLFFFITFFQGVLRIRYIVCILPPW